MGVTPPSYAKIVSDEEYEKNYKEKNGKLLAKVKEFSSNQHNNSSDNDITIDETIINCTDTTKPFS
jgi:hypothetical protein